ncbi:MAG: DUF1003 domain-containing protein [Vicinamibacterales bacterium]
MALEPRIIQEELHRLGDLERRVVARFIRASAPPVQNPNVVFDERQTFGQRVADRVAAFGGSWVFIFGFLVVMTLWMIVNARSARPFDPFPFILLNLLLSCLAALQAPVIMMSQNRQAAKDRLEAQHDYEVNLRAELEIVSLHAKLDELRDAQWRTLIDLQERQMAILERLEAQRDGDGA